MLVLKRLVVLMAASFFMAVGFADGLQIELTQGIDSAIPVAVIPFQWQGEKAPQGIDELNHVIKNDLRNSGLFRVMRDKLIRRYPHTTKDIDYAYWRDRGVDNLIIGTIKPVSDKKYRVDFALLDVFKGQKPDVVSEDEKDPEAVKPTVPKDPHVLLSKSFTVNADQLRPLAHHASDLIYEQLTGKRGIFSTKIAYILVKREPHKATEYLLEVADADGHQPKTLVKSNQPMMSPAWSKDGRRIAYVGFENRRNQIFTVDLRTGKRRLITNFDGINGAPAWSPDGKQMALVLSKNGHPKIYRLDIAKRRLKQLTHGWSIDTEPSWSNDGKRLIFTSDRAHHPQIYEMELETGSVQRITFEGNYNARASFFPDGQKIVMLHRRFRSFNIAVEDLLTKKVQELTKAGNDESPSVAPNGSMIIYASHQGKKAILKVVSADGQVKLSLPAREGDVQEPAWQPFVV